MSRDGISILTTTLPACSEHLVETAKSIAAVKASFPGPLDWIVVVDGPGDIPDVSGVLEARIIPLAKHTGLPAGRNAGLAEVATEWVMPLDHDDLLDEAGFGAMWLAIQDREHDWFAGNVTLVGGGTSPHYSLTPKIFRPCQLESEWTAPFRFYPNAVIAKTQAALAVGGWPALEAAEDLGLVFALNEFRTGAFLPHTIMRYRVWDRQITQSAGYQATKRRAFSALASMINARRAANGMGPVHVPDISGSYESTTLPSYWEKAVAPGPRTP